MPLSGELENYPNDVISGGGWRLECKGRSSGLGFFYRWLDGVDILAVKDGQGWLFAARLTEYVQALWEPPHQVVGSVLEDIVEMLRSGDIPVDGRLVRVRRVPGGLDQVRAWLLAEDAEALCFKADRRDWLVICDGLHMDRILAAMRAAPLGVKEQA